MEPSGSKSWEDWTRPPMDRVCQHHLDGICQHQFQHCSDPQLVHKTLTPLLSLLPCSPWALLRSGTLLKAWRMSADGLTSSRSRTQTTMNTMITLSSSHGKTLGLQACKVSLLLQEFRKEGGWVWATGPTGVLEALAQAREGCQGRGAVATSALEEHGSGLMSPGSQKPSGPLLFPPGNLVPRANSEDERWWSGQSRAGTWDYVSDRISGWVSELLVAPIEKIK